ADEDLIKSATFAKLSAKLDGIDGFIVGQFKVNRNWDSNKILAYLTKQENVVRDEVMITFREGIWAKEIAGLIEEKLGVKADDLLNLWNDDTFLNTLIEKYEFLDASILNEQYRVKLEGFLFPETYSFNRKATAQEITYTFLDHFEKEYQSIKTAVKESGMSMHDVITLASVVQYESKSKEDMQMIAGVFFNRLKQDMPLQSSVTVCYAMYEYDSWEECEMNTDIDSLYNTYQHTGLPIGPILNPGAEAINAVLNPKANDYLYFIADINNVKKEGSGKVFYSKTMEEHTKLQKELGLSW
ncbi:MAG: endolytic transglycosylase MltG, partial [Erysipelotrichia bacterium]|nr:endolytic transglycosylase MltG [Erysipelotrichia bacterium]